MPQLLVRDVPPDVVEALKRRAQEQGRSAEAEHRAILEETLCAGRNGRNGFWERAAKLREETRGRIKIPSEVLIRQDRDER
jgi:antitoxin FitA